jgi:hypothetical protein
VGAPERIIVPHFGDHTGVPPDQVAQRSPVVNPRCVPKVWVLQEVPTAGITQSGSHKVFPPFGPSWGTPEGFPQRGSRDGLPQRRALSGVLT